VVLATVRKVGLPNQPKDNIEAWDGEENHCVLRIRSMSKALERTQKSAACT